MLEAQILNVGWFMKGWGEVDRGRGSIWFFFGRPDGFGSSDFVQNVQFLCSIDLYGFRVLIP